MPQATHINNGAIGVNLVTTVPSDFKNVSADRPSRRAPRHHYGCQQYKRINQPERVQPKKSTVFPLAEHLYKLEFDFTEEKLELTQRYLLESNQILSMLFHVKSGRLYAGYKWNTE